MLDRLTQTLDFHGQALTLRSQRQQLIAGNIANADTPGYRAREMDFAQALRAATGALPAGSGLAVTQPGHIGTAQGSTGAGPTALRYATPSQPNLDGNSVDMDRERASFVDNALRYEATLRFINGHVKTTLAAITGQ